MKRDKFCQRNSLMARYGAEYLMDIWNNNSFCYLDVYRTIGYSASKIEAEMRFKNQVEQNTILEGEVDVMVEWFIQASMRQKSTETCIFKLLMPNAFSEQPLVRKLPSLKIPIAFLYGVNDWMARESADDLVFRGEVNGEVFETQNSGHYLYVEAPHECCSSIIKFVHGDEAQAQFLQTN